ncbi:MAG: hypothetical protein J5649_08985 [Lachnospiraceae bacterium]|nr:hypothetical protein [Lachnospiraceae bacterium]
MKKLIALLMVLCLSVTLLAGCGSKDGEDENPKPKLVKGDMFDMLEAMGNTTSGVVTAEFAFDFDGQTGKGAITYDVDAASKSCSFGLSLDIDVKGQKMSVALNDIAKVVDSNLYINLKGIADEAMKLMVTMSPDQAEALKGSLDTSKLGWFKFPLPDDLPDYNDKLQKNYVNSFVSLFENMLKNTKQEGEDGDYTAVLKTKEDYAQAVTAIRDFIKSDFKGIFEDSKKSVTDFNFDVEKYFDKLVSTYKADALEIGKDYGLTEEQLDQMIQSVKDMKLNEQFDKMKKQYEEEAAQAVITDEQINEMTKELDDAIEKIKAFEGEVPLKSTIRVAVDDDTYVADLKLASDAEDSKGSMSLKLTVKPGNPDVKAPDGVMSVKEIADIVVPLLSLNPVPNPNPDLTPTPIVIDDPTPTPTEAPAPTDVPATPTPEPTDVPSDPTPTPADVDNGTGYSNGKATIAMENGKTITFDLAGDWTLFDASEGELMLSKGSDYVQFTTMDMTGVPDAQFQALLEQYASAYEKLDPTNGWSIYKLTDGMFACIQRTGDTYVGISVIGSADLAKSVCESVTNMKEN